jgi:hypothetical protein
VRDSNQLCLSICSLQLRLWLCGFEARRKTKINRRERKEEKRREEGRKKENQQRYWRRIKKKKPNNTNNRQPGFFFENKARPALKLKLAPPWTLSVGIGIGGVIYFYLCDCKLSRLVFEAADFPVKNPGLWGSASRCCGLSAVQCAMRTCGISGI